MLSAYLCGVGTGWYLLRPGGRYYKAPLTAVPAPQPQKGAAALPPQGEPIAPVTSPQSAPQSQLPVQNPASGKVNGAPPLTFYNTLQKGNKGLIGTGINQPKEGQPATTLPPATAPVQAAPPQPASPKPAER
jgi:hypothetical protein